MLFQKSILKKYLAQIPAASVRAAWERFTDYFHNPERQRNIRALKEEQYQGEFLEKLFGSIFGYTLNPDPGFNLLREQKNVTNAKSADGAILKDQKVFAVIELKDTNTRDLTRVEEQAFGYKNAHPGVNYVVISNFEKLRFYIDSTVNYIEFDLFTLTEPEFKLLYFCLSADSLLENAPLRAHAETVSAEESITKRLYGDYSRFKRLLFADLCERNADRGLDRLLLFRKTQKLLDRLIFIFFCEDRGLLPANSIAKIITSWREQSIWSPRPLYDQFRTFFNFVNAGQPQLGIFAYNGGLFAPDELLDSLKIDDELLVEHTQLLSNYDFESEVDVNILGHIFEHSLTEIEEIKSSNLQAPLKGELPATSLKAPLKGGLASEARRGGSETGEEQNHFQNPSTASGGPPPLSGEALNSPAPPLSGEALNSTVNKRKRDGVFYTPPYITRFIVENTLGALCARKKTELGISDETYAASETFTSAQRRKLEETLFAYRDWLLDLKICDPACGSGAFLVAALNFLIEEHAHVDAWYTRLHYGKDSSRGQSALILTDLDQSILERNLYGVDINEESVEIARLSLWLHTCKPGRKLNSLTQNIKCGNSLLDAEFDWKTEFPFDGFDVVIGNPPYVQLQTMGAMSDVYAAAGFRSFNKSADLYCLFTERGYDLLRPGGFLSFIMPNKWMITSYGKQLRQFMAGTGLQQILNFGDVQFFDDATTYCCIFVTAKEPKPETVRVLSVNRKTYTGFDSAIAGRYEYPSGAFGESEWSIQPLEDFQTLQRMKETGTPLKELPVTIYRGILTGYNDAFFIDTATKERLIREDARSAELIRPLLRGRDIVAYGADWDDLWLIGTFPALHLNIDEYPAIQKHLLSFGKERLNQSGEKGSRKKTSNQWFETQDTISYYEDFAKPKIIYPNMTSVFPFMYDTSGFVSNDKSFIMTADDDSVSLPFLTAVFNSSLAKLWIWYNCPELQGGTREVRKVFFENFPVPPADAAQTASLAALTRDRTAAVSALQTLRRNFARLVQANFPGVKMTSVLTGLETLDFPAFLKELGRQKHRIPLKDQTEWAELIGENPPPPAP
ncbi:MAG: N-6 DNA methylase [Thermoguttaceae bacterium]|nr:N-6 DNA methylase [Thermoguttaceae bacterium]